VANFIPGEVYNVGGRQEWEKEIKDLGHDPKVTPEEGIRRTVEWLKSIYHSEV